MYLYIKKTNKRHNTAIFVTFNAIQINISIPPNPKCGN